MSLDSTVQRVAAINTAIANPALLIQGALASRSSTAVSQTGGTEAPSSSGTFAQALAQAGTSTDTEGSSSAATTSYSGEAAPGLSPSTLGSTGVSTYSTAPGGISPTSAGSVSQVSPLGGTSASESPGQRIVAIAETQIGQTEQPPGSNESPAIAQYRTATQGAIPGAPWCAYFASWAAREAGEPLGSQGQGLGAVSEIWSWAQSVGRAIPNGPGVVPQPGDLMVFGGEHVCIVKRVLPNGNIETIEGNYENKVALNVRTPSEPTGYVNMS